MNEKEIMQETPAAKGRDLAAPVRYATYCGKRLPLVYNNRQARICEDIYASEFGRDIGFYKIMDEVKMPKHQALMAMVYSALVAGGAEIPWEEFDENFRITDIDGVTAAILKDLVASMPDEDPDEPKDLPEAPATPMD